MTAPTQNIRNVLDLVSEWTSGTTGQDYSTTRDLILFLAEQLYSQFQPDASKPLFMERLASWLGNVDSTEDKQRLFDFVPWLLFVGQKELESMYVSAFQGPIARWIIDDAGIDVSAESFAQNFRNAVACTFFGSIAGMDLPGFLRINVIQGQSIRPDFRQLSRVGNRADLLTETSAYDRVVAVEDMVATGTQMSEAVPALQWFSPKPVLFCPFIMAPQAWGLFETDIKSQSENDHMSLSPLFVIPRNATLPAVLPFEHPEPLRRLHQMAIALDTKVRGAKNDPQYYGPFGCGDFGSLVLTYLNCPDNVPPLIHYTSESWNPLFPRNSREGK